MAAARLVTRKRHVTYLQQTGLTRDPPVAPPRPNTLVRSAVLRPQEYRRLYGNLALGRREAGRLALDPHELSLRLAAPDRQCFVMETEGNPVGFCELHRAGWDELELVCWGMLRSMAQPAALAYLLDHTARALWVDKPRRLWLRVHDADPPELLQTVLAVSFGIYDRRFEDVTEDAEDEDI